VAVQLVVSASPGSLGQATTGDGRVDVALRVPGTTPPAGRWAASTVGSDLPALSGTPSVTLDAAGGATVIRTSAALPLADLAYADATLVATAFTPPAAVPVAVSQGLVDAVRTTVGGALTMSVSGVGVPVRVVAVVPAVPSVPGQVAVLADSDELSRALIGAGQLQPAVDAWWVGHPRVDAASAARALGLGDVVTRQEVQTQLTRGPLRVTVPAVLLTLVVAAVLLALAGTAVLLTADLQVRSAEVARLRALGLTRPAVLGCLLGQHGAVLVLLVLSGTAVGAAASVVLAPLLVRSDVGAAPVPPALVRWPWGAEAGLVAGLAAGVVVVTALVAVRHVRRAEARHLRLADA
jgi:predicted lysophospholipase L1 biosynthesis ABC-type transport system permease subunit